MEHLLWHYPTEFLSEKLHKFKDGRQRSSAVGRSDLVFEDETGALLLIEIKRGTSTRGAGFQVLTYATELKLQFGDRNIRKMVVANTIPQKFRPTLNELGIAW